MTTTLRERVRKKSSGMFGLVSPKNKLPASYFIRNPTSYIELAIQEVGIPLTVKLLENNSTESLTQDDVLTIHQRCEIPKLECVRSNGDLYEIPVELPCRVNYIDIDKTTIYHTIGDVVEKRKQDDVVWIVVTKPFVYQGFVYNPGFIFEVLNDETDEDVLPVEMHPGRLLVFLPVQIRGEFRKCNSPYFESECELSELLKEEAPYFITIATADINKLHNQHIDLPCDRLFVRDKKTDHVLIASTYSKQYELFQIHLFPVDFPLKCEILLGGKPVDILKKEELQIIKEKLILCDPNKIKNHLALTYEHAGIKRLKYKRNGKLRKKDIRAPQALEDIDYARYMEGPTNLLKELNLNIGTLSCMTTDNRKNSQGSPTLSNDSVPNSFDSDDSEKRKRKRMSIGRRSVYSLQFENLSVDEVMQLLNNLSLEEHIETIRSEHINGKLLTIFDTNDFMELGMDKEDAQKLYTYVNGYMFGTDEAMD